MFIRKFKLILSAILTVILLSGCNINNITKETNQEGSNNLQEATVTNIDLQEDEVVMKINIQVGSDYFTAILYDNQTAKELLSKMPMTITMNEMNGNEKFHNMAEALTTNSEKVGSINNGDLMLYGSDCLVLFYKSFKTPYSYTKIGYIENPYELENTLGYGDVEVIYSKNVD